MKEILVTGGCGFLGSELVRHLFNDTDYNIVIVDKLYFGKDSIKDILDNKRIKLFRCDIRNIENRGSMFKDIDTVVHLAALSNDASSDLNPVATKGINVEGTRKVLDLCVKHNIKKFIFASTSSIYGFNESMVDETAPANPLSTYGKSKLMAENVIKVYSKFIKDIYILRLATLFGYSRRFRTDLVVNTMIKDAITRGEINIHGSGSQYRPLLHVKDLANIITLLINNGRQGCETYNIVDFNMTVSALADEIATIIGPQRKSSIHINRSLDSAKDKLNYNISNKKFLEDYNYKFRYTIRDTAKEICEARNRGEIADLNSPIYHNTDWLRHLLCAERYIKNIKGAVL